MLFNKCRKITQIFILNILAVLTNDEDIGVNAQENDSVETIQQER